MNEGSAKWLRIILGLFLIIYGLNQWFHFYPTSYGGNMPLESKQFLDAVVIYLPFLYILEIIIGVFLLLNKWTSLILIILFPLSVCFLIFVFSNRDITEMWQAILVAALNITLLFQSREKYMPLLD